MSAGPMTLILVLLTVSAVSASDNTIHGADAVRYMSVNVGIQPLRCTDSHGQRPRNALTCRSLET
jgi:hypothetical protein